MVRSGSDKKGLWVGGEAITRTGAQFLSVIKYAVVPKSSWNLPAFKSDDLAQVIVLADKLALEIALAMIDDYIAHDFASPPDLADNIALRKGVIASMQALCSGEVDSDYTEPTVGVPSTLGYLPSLEVLVTPGAETGEGLLTKPLPFAPPDASWEQMPSFSAWGGPAFVQKPGVALSAALQDITPFRGECCGGLQLSMLLGCLKGLGAEKVDALDAHFGPAYIGVWRQTDTVSGKGTFTTASRFLSHLHDIDPDYPRGKVLGVPGDFMYFQNKDGYGDLAPNGGWIGENCVYMGKDALGDPHYSGMGLAWKSEFALRMFLSNAYFTDCNGPYLASLRAGKTPEKPPVFVQDEQAEVRFTSRAVTRYPALPDAPAPVFEKPVLDGLLTPEQFVRAMEELGKPVGKGYILDDLLLSQILDGLRIPQSALRQPAKSSVSFAGLELRVDGWKLAIQPVQQGLSHLRLDDRVVAQAVRLG